MPIPSFFFLQHWNQLSRLQRNFIFITVVVVVITLLLLIPNDKPKENFNEESAHIRIEPFDEPKLPKPNIQNVLPNQIDEAVKESPNDNINQNVDSILEEPREQANDENSIKNAIDTIEREGEGAKDFKGATNSRQKAVVDALKHAWKGYKEFAWGHDNLKPMSMGSHDWFGLGLTIVDSLDTLYIMDLQEGMCVCAGVCFRIDRRCGGYSGSH